MIELQITEDSSTPKEYRILMVDGEARFLPPVEHYCLPFSQDIA